MKNMVYCRHTTKNTRARGRKGSVRMRRRKEELTISETEHRANLRTLFSGIFVMTVFVWVFRFCLGGLAGLTAPYIESYYLRTTLLTLAEGLSVFLPFLIFQKAIRERLAPVFREKARSEHPVLRSVIGILAVFCLTVAVLTTMHVLLDVFASNGLFSDITVPDVGKTTGETAFYLVLTTLVYSFVYEFAFRGIAMRAMAPENQAAAVFVSGLAFAFSDGNPYHIAVRLSIGFVMGYFYLRIRSLWACVALQAASWTVITLFWKYAFLQTSRFIYPGFLILAGFALGTCAAFFLFYPSRKKEDQITSNSVAFSQVFGSFGVWLMIALVSFNLLTFTFRQEGARDQETPESGRTGPLFNDPTDRKENIPNYQDDFND